MFGNTKLITKQVTSQVRRSVMRLICNAGKSRYVMLSQPSIAEALDSWQKLNNEMKLETFWQNWRYDASPNSGKKDTLSDFQKDTTSRQGNILQRCEMSNSHFPRTNSCSSLAWNYTGRWPQCLQSKPEGNWGKFFMLFIIK